MPWMLIARELRRLRLEKNFDREEAARRAGVPVRTLRRHELERGSPRPVLLETIRQYEAAYDAPAEQFSYWVDRAEQPPPRVRRPLTRISNPTPGQTAEAPDEVWEVDLVGPVLMLDGVAYETLCVRDQWSGYWLDVRLVPDGDPLLIRRAVDRLFARYGQPRTIQTGAIPPFRSRFALSGLTELSAWWLSLGIKLLRGVSAREEAGATRHELVALLNGQAHSRLAQQALYDDWEIDENARREGLKPSRAQLYGMPRGPLAAPAVFPAGCALHPVDTRGYIRQDGREIYIATAVAGYRVGLRSEGGNVCVWFYGRPIGVLSATGDRVLPWNASRVEPRAA